MAGKKLLTEADIIARLQAGETLRFVPREVSGIPGPKDLRDGYLGTQKLTDSEEMLVSGMGRTTLKPREDRETGCRYFTLRED